MGGDLLLLLRSPGSRRCSQAPSAASPTAPQMQIHSALVIRRWDTHSWTQSLLRQQRVLYGAVKGGGGDSSCMELLKPNRLPVGTSAVSG